VGICARHRSRYIVASYQHGQGASAEGNRSPVQLCCKAEAGVSSLQERFEGDNGHLILIDALRRQALIQGDASLAESFAQRGELVRLEPGERLIEQGSWNDLYFILAGSFEVSVNGLVKATRHAGEHVGELAGLSGARSRTATLVAVDESLVLRVNQSLLQGLVGNNADFWRAAANVVADRLDQRNLEVGTANEIPRLFVISSKEALDVARQIRSELDSENLHVFLWNKGTFGISEYPISDLEDAIEAADFTVAVVRSDDTLVSRGQSSTVARDNVHLEYGLSLGKLGRLRSLLLVEAEPSLRLPSDLAGLTTVRYRARNQDEMERTIAIACDDIRKHTDQHGVRQDRIKR
jgi:CRP/FNR family cyclic AMP-dependent transcriptional regulator